MSMLGKKQSKEARMKMSKSHLGEKHPNWKGGLPSCLDCGKKLSRYDSRYCRRCCLSGERGSNWQGGLTKLYPKIRNCFEYRQWVSDIMQRDNFTCQWCDKRGGDLEVHHLDKFSSIIKRNGIKTLEDALRCAELWNINNGVTLCLDCHNPTKNRWVN